MERDLTTVNPEDLKRFTCDKFGECGYTSDASPTTLASHLRTVHGESSKGVSIETFVDEGFVRGLNDDPDSATEFLLFRVYGMETPKYSVAS